MCVCAALVLTPKRLCLRWPILSTILCHATLSSCYGQHLREVRVCVFVCVCALFLSACPVIPYALPAPDLAPNSLF